MVKTKNKVLLILFAPVLLSGVFFYGYILFQKNSFSFYNSTIKFEENEKLLRAVQFKNEELFEGEVNYSKEKTKDRKKLKSFFNRKKDYQEVFAQCPEKESSQKENRRTIAGIAPHHFLAKKSLACFYNNISRSSIENVILIGPDHFHNTFPEKISFYTTKKVWETPFGDLLPNEKIISEITKLPFIRENDDIFLTEHSIYTEIPFIKKVFPQAKIVPLVVKNGSDYQSFMKEGERLKNLIKDSGETILLVSSDFTHHSTNKEAIIKDAQSIKILKTKNFNKINKITCDCRSCLAVLFGYLNKTNSNNTISDNYQFQLFANKNSTNFGGADKNVTSYVMGEYLQND